MHIQSLISGGVISNYYCSSRCAHCLYRCSPEWSKDYISVETAVMIFKRLKRMGISSVHIGGGEPFLNLDGLKALLSTAQSSDIQIEYVETNAAWFRDSDSAEEILSELQTVGLNSLLVSISPFHNESIPFYKTKGLLTACRKAGISTFPWVMDFYSDLDHFDENHPHALSEYENVFSSDYVARIPGRYWIHMGGRAVVTYRKLFSKIPLRLILARSGPCMELTDTSHFHMDLYGKYIPGLCSGLAICIDELKDPIPADKYPLLTVLYKEGVRGIYKIAEKYNHFGPRSAYLNKCDLCLDIRDFLYRKDADAFPELSPSGFYQTSDK
mgnify:CR=1 FL=1